MNTNHNLDDILIEDSLEKKPKSKRKILIVVASILLIGVVGIAGFFVLGQKNDQKELEISHAELEKLAESQEGTTKTEDEFDKLIAEIKSKHSKEESKSKVPQAQGISNTKAPQTKQEAPVVANETQGIQATPATTQDLAKADNKESPKEGNKKVSNAPKTDKSASVKQDSQKKVQKSGEQKSESKATSSRGATQQTAKKIQSAGETFNALSVPKGFYLQIGVFSNKPNAKFLDKLSEFAYQVEQINQGGRVVSRYLVGPFASRELAQEQFQVVSEKIAKPVIVEIK